MGVRSGCDDTGPVAVLFGAYEWARSIATTCRS